MSKYKRVSVDLDNEKSITIGCIVSSHFVRDFSILIGGDLNLITSKYLRIIISWAISYYQKYDKCCNESIMEVFKAEKSKIVSEDEIELIEDTIYSINEKYIEEGDKFDWQFKFNEAEKYIKGRSLEENADVVKGLVKLGRISEAERIHKEYKRKEKTELKATNVLVDMNSVDEMFEADASIMEFPGALGELIQEIYKGDLVFLASLSKFGKTWMLLQIALWASSQGLKVAFFSFEMQAKLINRRLAQIITGKSFKEFKKQANVPEFDKNNNIVYRKETVKQMTQEDVKRSYRLQNRQNEKGGIWVFDSTKSGRTIDDIKNTVINSSEYSDLDFDLLLIDQLSLIQGGRGKEKRHILDDIALRLKTEICEDMQLPVITPIQHNKEAAKTHSGDEYNLNESFSIFHHSSLLINLNRSKEEREKGLMRVSCSGRHNNYTGEVVVPQCLDIGRFVLDSRWKKDIPNYNDVLCMDVFDEDDLIDLEDV